MSYSLDNNYTYNPHSGTAWLCSKLVLKFVDKNCIDQSLHNIPNNLLYAKTINSYCCLIFRNSLPENRITCQGFFKIKICIKICQWNLPKTFNLSISGVTSSVLEETFKKFSVWFYFIFYTNMQTTSIWSWMKWIITQPYYSLKSQLFT